MTHYTHRLTLAVPKALMPQANQLALIVGENAADANTFQQANWQDAHGNLYAVCSTVAKPVVLHMLGKQLKQENIPAHAGGADLAMAQQALDSIALFELATEETPATQVTPQQITLAIDHDPLPALAEMGLTQVPYEDNNI